MPDYFDRPARKSPRLKDYDYTQDGAYFVTICTQNRMHLFGSVVDQEMRLNAAGMMVAGCWQWMSEKFADVELDGFVVMPNHVHGIIGLNGAIGIGDRATTLGRPYGVSDVVGWFKTISTNHYMRGVKQADWEPFLGKLWQRSFHDRIIRSEKECNTLREYMLTNPARWEDDTFYRAKIQEQEEVGMKRNLLF